MAGGGGTNTTGYLKGYAGSTEGGGQTNIGNYAWYTTNSGNKTHSVGGKTANELGLYDMSGNVYEWCWDRDGSYPSGKKTDYRGADLGNERVLHGGSWGYGAAICTVAYRGKSNPSTNDNNIIGFRVVRS